MKKAILGAILCFSSISLCDSREACDIVEAISGNNKYDQAPLIKHLAEVCDSEAMRARLSCICRDNNPPDGCEVNDPSDCKICITGACDRCCKAWFNIDTAAWIGCMQGCCNGGYTKEERPPGSGKYVGVCVKRQVVVDDPVAIDK